MDKENKIRGLEWTKKAEHDFEAMELLLRNSGPADVAGVLLQQGTEKYLKGYLISHGWKLLKTHDLKELLDEAVNYDKRFEKYYDLSDMLTEVYFEEKYPFGKTEITLPEIRDRFEQAKELVELIKDSWEKDVCP